MSNVDEKGAVTNTRAEDVRQMVREWGMFLHEGRRCA